MLTIAHRGASGYERENTIASFEKAIELGADYVELDVRRTRDNVLVVHHDAVFDDGRRIDQTPYQVIQAWAHAQEWQVPVLDEVLAVILPRIGVNIEIKDPEPLLLDLLIACTKKVVLDTVIFSSFDHDCLMPLKGAFPSAGRGLLVEGLPADPVQLLHAYATDLLIARFEMVTPDYVTVLHRHKKRIFVWTVDEKKDIQQSLACGVDGMVSNYPDRVREVCG